MIFVLVPLRWRVRGTAPAVFRAADLFSYHLVPPEVSMFAISESFQPLDVAQEAPPVLLPDAASTFILPAEISEFVIPPELSYFGVGLS